MTKIIVPTSTSAAGTSRKLPRSGFPSAFIVTISAVVGTVPHSAFKSPLACNVKRFSTKCAAANNTNNNAPSMAHPSKIVPNTAKIVNTCMFTRPAARSYAKFTNSGVPAKKYTSATHTFETWAAVDVRTNPAPPPCAPKCAIPPTANNTNANTATMAFPYKKSATLRTPVASNTASNARSTADL